MAARDRPFVEAVRQQFAPIADRAGFTLDQLSDSGFEIVGPTYCMRIRRGTGHADPILVTLCRSATRRGFDAFDGEIGLGVFAEYHGHRIEDMPLENHAQYLRHVTITATESERLLIPYLKDEGKDFDAVLALVERKMAEVRGAWDYNFPKTVRFRWFRKND